MAKKTLKKAKPIKVAQPKNSENVVAGNKLLLIASQLLFIAAGVSALMIACLFLLPDGLKAVPSIGGLAQENVIESTARIVFSIDLLFPLMFYGGLMMMAVAFQTRGNRPLVRLSLTALLIVLTADCVENVLALEGMLQNNWSVFLKPVSIIKFIILAIAAILISAIINTSGMFGKLVAAILRFIFPVLTVMSLSGLKFEYSEYTGAIILTVLLLILAQYAFMQSSSSELTRTRSC